MGVIHRFEHLENVLEDVNKLLEGYDLLEQVYLEHGPYGDCPIPDELRYKINNYFDFDDSE
jgi:hypothetical protein